jgi:histidinol dehydrogenase
MGVGSAMSTKEDVSEVISAVRKFGDKAVQFYEDAFSVENITQNDYDTGKLLTSIDVIVEKIRRYQEAIMPQEKVITNGGITVRLKIEPIDNVGIYVPHGYYSSLLHCLIPARVAGVRNIVICQKVGDHDYHISEPIFDKLQVGRIYNISGAQAIAAMAYGTETVPKVDKIVGPGGPYVVEAKRQVYGDVGIDMLAGPSELQYVAKDSQEVLDFADNSVDACKEHNGAYWLNMENGCSEVLETWGIDRDIVCKCGAICKNTPHPLMDYAGPISHVLPTGRSCRWSSGLSVYDFIRMVPTIEVDHSKCKEEAEAAITLAKAEGFDAHARAIEKWQN